jgi:hypothetical protein
VRLEVIDAGRAGLRTNEFVRGLGDLADRQSRIQIKVGCLLHHLHEQVAWDFAQGIASALCRATILSKQAEISLAQFAKPVAGDEMNESAGLEAFLRLPKTKYGEIPVTHADLIFFQSGVRNLQCSAVRLMRVGFLLGFGGGDFLE